MGRNLTNLYVSESFQYLLQRSGSIVTNGVGTVVSNLDLVVTSAETSTTSSYVADSIYTASAVANIVTFTKGDGTTFDISVAQSGSVESSSYADFAQTANSAASATSASYALTASYVPGSDTAISSSYALSASFAQNAVSATSVPFAGITGKPTLLSGSAQIATQISGAFTATSASIAADIEDILDGTTPVAYSSNTIVYGKNLHNLTLAKGTPVYFTGSGTSGNLVGLYPADAGNPARMPAGGVVGESIAVGAEGIVLVDGFINEVNTSTFASGDEVYVAVGGGYTNIVPTGSANQIQKLGNVEKSAINGSGVINGPGASRSVPNIAQNHVWKGDANGVAQPVNQNTLSVATAVTASYATKAASVDPLNQKLEVTGSTYIQGDAFVDGNIRAGYDGSGDIYVNGTGNGNQYGVIGVVTDTDTFPGNHYSAFQIIDNDGAGGQGVNGFNSSLEYTAFSGLDGSNPVARLRMGGNNGTDQSTVIWSSKAKPYAHFTKQSVFLSAVTASAVISASAGIIGDVTGTATSASHAVSALSASHALVSDTVNDANVAYINVNNNFTGTQTFNNIAVNGTGSFAYIQSVTGSAKIIGDAFIILNNDLPAERYAGIKVIDSGSIPATTASLLFDGQTNDWFYEYEKSGDPDDFAVFLAGPEYSTKGAPVYPNSNQLQKGTGGHHLTGSLLSDDGTTVSMTGDLDVTGTSRVTGSINVSTNAFVGDTVYANNNIRAGYDGSGDIYVNGQSNGNQYGVIGVVTDTDTFTGNHYSAFQIIDNDGGGGSGVNGFNSSLEYTAFSGLDGSNPVARLRMGGDNGTDGNTLIWSSKAKPYGHFTKQLVFQSPVTASAVISASAGIIGDVTGNASTATTASFATKAASVGRLNQKLELTGSAYVSNSIFVNNDAFVNSTIRAGYDGSGDIYVNGQGNGNQFGVIGVVTDTDTFTGNHYSAFQIIDNDGAGGQGVNGFNSSLEYTAYSGLDGSNPVARLRMGGNNGTDGNTLIWSSKAKPYGHFTKQLVFLSPVTASAALSASAGIIGDLTGNASTATSASYSLVATSASYAPTNTAANITWTGNQIFSGSVRGDVNSISIASSTGSLDMSLGNFFSITLGNGIDTHLDATNINPGQTINLKVKNNATAAGTLSFSPEFKFAGGTPPTVTAATNAEDILTFISFDGTTLYGTSVLNLS